MSERRVRLGFLLDFNRTADESRSPGFPRQDPLDIHVPVSSHSRTEPEAYGLDAPLTLGVPARPDACDCGAQAVALVACWERCSSRSTRGSAQ